MEFEQRVELTQAAELTQGEPVYPYAPTPVGDGVVPPLPRGAPQPPPPASVPVPPPLQARTVPPRWPAPSWPPAEELGRPDRAPQRRWRFAPRSLTGRLVAGVVALVVVLVFATGISTYFALRSFLYSRLDQQLQPLAAVNATDAQNYLSSGRPSSGSSGFFRGNQKVWIAVLTSTGEPSSLLGPNVNNVGVEQMKLDLGAGRRLVQDTDAPDTVTTSDGQQLRASSHEISSPVGPLFVVTGLSTGELSATLNRLVELELAIGATAGVLALVATAYGVHRSLRRLHQVTATAQEVAAELSPEGTGLDRRVEVDEEGTEVGRLAESMNTLLAAVETQFAARLESEQRMRQFLADASHELRTPLTSIRGYAELARMQRTVDPADGRPSDPAGADTTADNLERIESEGTRMSRLVDDLLTLARGDQGASPEQVSVDVGELLDDVASSARAAFANREIEVVAPLGLAVQGDHDQLLRAVRNLVTNAAAHTRPDGRISVRAFPDGPGAAIQVVDEGPGLPPQEAAHVFERFWRADKARSRARGGSGLGLAIVASIVKAHGGTVRFDSTVEHGSTVTLWLPSAPA